MPVFITASDMFDFKNESNFIQLESDPDCFTCTRGFEVGHLLQRPPSRVVRQTAMRAVPPNVEVTGGQ